MKRRELAALLMLLVATPLGVLGCLSQSSVVLTGAVLAWMSTAVLYQSLWLEATKVKDKLYTVLATHLRRVRDSGKPFAAGAAVAAMKYIKSTEARKLFDLLDLIDENHPRVSDVLELKSVLRRLIALLAVERIDDERPRLG